MLGGALVLAAAEAELAGDDLAQQLPGRAELAPGERLQPGVDGVPAAEPEEVLRGLDGHEAPVGGARPVAGPPAPPPLGTRHRPPRAPAEPQRLGLVEPA